MPWQRRACLAALAEVHPRYYTPKNAILLIGALSVISLGRPALVWLVNAGVGIVVAYAFVALSFLALRNEPELERPYQAPGGSFTGYLALVLSAAIGALYFPGSPSALIWPQEWAINKALDHSGCTAIRPVTALNRAD